MDGAITIIVLCVVLYKLFVMVRSWHHRRGLPSPSLTPWQAEAFQSQAFRQICRRSNGPQARAVYMGDYFTEQGWNRADAMFILAEPLKHGLIKIYGWKFGIYRPTRAGWDEYRRNFMWTGSSEVVNISASSGGFVVANVDSPRAVAHGGHDNSADVHEVSHRQLIDALREDARSADPNEGRTAREYAHDLAEAVQTESPSRADLILGRINQLLASASSAFALTKDLLPR